MEYVPYISPSSCGHCSLNVGKYTIIHTFMGKDWCDNEHLTTTMIFFGFQLFRTCVEAAEGHDSTEFREDLDAGGSRKEARLLGTFRGQPSQKDARQRHGSGLFWLVPLVWKFREFPECFRFEFRGLRLGLWYYVKV